MGGSFNSIGGVTRYNLARLNTDGTLDTGFDPNVNGPVSSISVQSDGKVLAGGFFTTVGGVARNNIARLNADGTFDMYFNPSTNNYVNSIVLQSDGRILVGGNFTTVGGVARNRIARLYADGTLDSTFDPSADNSVYSIAVQSDGKILAGGSFTSIGGQARNRIARLTNTGAALQELSASSNGSAVTWTRGQASPEVWRVTFEHSPDGVAWSSLGNATRISGGWQLTGLSLPFKQNHYVRARGYAAGGYCNASGSLVESIRVFYLSPLFMAVKGVSNNAIYVHSMADPGSWGSWSQLQGSTSQAPALASFNNRLYMAVKGATNNNIYIRYMDAFRDLERLDAGLRRDRACPCPRSLQRASLPGGQGGFEQQPLPPLHGYFGELGLLLDDDPRPDGRGSCPGKLQ